MTSPVPPKTVVIGAAGLVGRRVLEAYQRSYPDLVGTDWQEREGLGRLDLAAPDPSPLRLAESGHTWALIAAGMRDYAECEQRRADTRARNVVGTLELARRLVEMGLRVACISSDAVFDGKAGGYADDAPLNPVNEYGRQKADLERELPRVTSGRGLILRVGRVVGARKGDGTLPDEIAARLVSGRFVDAAHDQVFTPVVLDDLPRVLATLQAQNASGLFNVAGPEAWSRLDIAVRLAQGLGVDQALVRRISLDDLGDGVTRPKNLSLRCGRLRALGIEMTPLSRCLERVVENHRNAGADAGA